MDDFMNDAEVTNRPDANNNTNNNDLSINSDKTIVVRMPAADDRTVVTNNKPADGGDRTIVVRPQNANDGMGNMTLQSVRPASVVSPIDMEDTTGDGFVLKGEYYKLEKSLSENSGEAQVFLVSKNGKQQVLKVYYPNYDVNKKLMQTIRNFQFEMIVHLDDFGKTYVDGKHRFYELMEYLQGGSLQEYHLDGNMDAFRRIALQGAAALAYCHTNNILHKDIKPSNFFFRDEEQTQLVLGDFGISSMLESDGKAYRTTQARTPVYAAPEMYADVIDGEVEITPAADFYSLGITLFALWIGENPMSSNERAMMRQKNEGKLPRLEELPPRVKQIVMGLTAVNPSSRWKYDEVERWFLGEDVPIDQSSPFLRYKSFIVDPDKNLVADNIQELVPMLLENELLAMNYLYNGRIVSWLEVCGNTKLSAVVKDIVVNKYPVDQKAGLMASVYVMDPEYSYRDIQNEPCEDVHSIALSLLSYKERYAIELQNPNHSLFLWLEYHTKADINRLRSYFTPDAEPLVAVMRLVYEIDPDVPFLSNHASATMQEIVHSFGYGTPTDDDWHSLIDGRLLSWMYSHEDMVACESLRILIQNQPFSMTLAYKVLYNMDRTAAYDLREAHTPAAVGEVLSELLVMAQHMKNEDLAVQLKDFTDPNGRFYYYAQMQGWYKEMSEATRCFDLNSEENRERLSAYDLHTAFYRFCCILGTIPTYKMPDGTEFKSLDLLKEKRLANYVRTELRTGSLAQWLSVFYHEDPSRDFSEEYSYERELEQWVHALGDLDEKNLFYKRFMKAREDTADRIAEVRRDWNSARNRERSLRYLFYLMATIWMALILIVGVNERSFLMEHSKTFILFPVGIMTALIVAVRSFFGGFGVFLSSLFGAIGYASAFIPVFVLKFVDVNYPSMFGPAVVILSLLYAIIGNYTDFRHDDKTSAKSIREILTTEDINTTLLEPLYYTFKTRSYRYKSTKFGLLDDISNQVRSTSGENVIHYIIWSILFLILILEFVALSPKILDVRKTKYAQEAPVELLEQTIQNELDQ